MFYLVANPEDRFSRNKAHFDIDSVVIIYQRMSLPNIHDAIPKNIYKVRARRVCDVMWRLELGNLC